MEPSKDETPPVPATKIKNIYQRMVEVQKIATTVSKDARVQMSANDKGYKAVTHDEVAGVLHLPLAECGVFMLPDITKFSTTEFEQKNKFNDLKKWYRTDIEILVKWINVDDPSDFIQSKGAAFAIDSSDKSFAKAYSLALKIVLLKVHLLESRDGEENRVLEQDDDDAPRQNNQRNQTSQVHAFPKPSGNKGPIISKSGGPIIENKIIVEDGPPDFNPNITPMDELVALAAAKSISKDEMYSIIQKVTGKQQLIKELSADALNDVIGFVKKFHLPKKTE